jgi:hypothetical protein
MQKEFKNKLSIADIEDILADNVNKMQLIANTNECRKWSNWWNHKGVPFPCACPTRNKDCVFAEVYYKFSELPKIVNFSKPCEDAVLDYQEIKESTEGVEMWLNKQEELYSSVSEFNNTVRVRARPYENQKFEIQFPTVVTDFILLYENAISIIEEHLAFLKTFPIGADLESLEYEMRFVGKSSVKKHYYDVYRQAKFVFKDVYGLDDVNKPLLYFHLNRLSIVEYQFEDEFYDYLLKKINTDLPLDILLEQRFDENLKSASCIYNNLTIELIQQENSTLILRLTDNQFT